MLVVALGKVMFTRGMAPAENGVHIVERRFLRQLADLVNFDFHFTGIRQVHLFGWAKDAVLENSVNGLLHNGLRFDKLSDAVQKPGFLKKPGLLISFSLIYLRT
jgi:hypothetical protein